MRAHPQDWPGPGPIDLSIHDLPHRSSAIEWWYLNCHLETDDARKFSLFAAFFRVIKDKDEQGLPRYAHSLTWALSDAEGRVYHAESRVDPAAPEIGLQRIKDGRGSRDPRLNRALTEILEQGRVPRPDRIFDGPVSIAFDRLALDFGGARFEKQPDGRYALTLANEKVACTLTFELKKPPHRHGDDGLVRGTHGENMFYYFIPRCAVTGSVTVDGKTQAVRQGQGWYDHEFGGHRPEGEKGDAGALVDIAWNWVSAQLEGGVDVTAYSLERVEDNKILHQWAVVSQPDGSFTSYKQMTLEPLRSWRSTRTFYDYPTEWRLRIPEAQLDLLVDAAFDDQEMITCISKPAFWEGRVAVRGTVGERDVVGLGYVERSGFEPIKDLDQFFSAVGEEVRRSVEEMMPLDLGVRAALDLIAAPGREQYLDGVDLPQLSRALIAPVRMITDRGGKSWRSYAALACCDVVQGDSRKFVQYLAMPELMHVGSLIVDDVQDKSTVRRGGPACHVTYGDAIAINAGTAAYFLTQRLLESVNVTPATRVRLYDYYFEAMRAGHAGQALDLAGLHEAMPAVIESGETAAVERRVLAIYRLKAGSPAASLARIGAVSGGGSEAQIEAVGHWFECLGLAFQIMDDVLNLRGFKNDLKQRGEDITNAVVTLPLLKALGRLPLEERRSLWKTIASRPTDVRVVAAVVERLETSGAVQACADEARDIVEAAWRRAEPHLPDSVSKVMMRAFGWYLLERHY